MAWSSAAAPRPLTEAWASAGGTICASLGAASRTRLKAPAAATVTSTVRQVGDDETPDIIMRLRERMSVAGPAW